MPTGNVGFARKMKMRRSVIAKYMGVGVEITAMTPPLRTSEAAANAAVRCTVTGWDAR